jgi:type I restriction enzyme S subunit
MTPEQLKASILQYAIQGKLVEQRAEEGTGEELYQQIQAEKQRLIQEKKIKKEKPLAEISEDEIPFDIPENWKWCRLSSLTYNWGQKTPDKTFCYIDVGSINNISHTLNIENTVVEAKDASSRAKKIVQKGDVIFATIRPYLKNICIIDRDFPYEPIVSTAFAVMHCPKGLLNKYLYYYLLSPTFMRFANASDKSKGVAYPAIGEKDFFNGLIALPPLAEQKRIVAKIEELLPLVDRYAVAYEKLEQFNAKFPEDMKKSILQYAIQGKLVEQRPEEGTGEELYQQIQTEKQRLIKEGKIKKEKPLPEIVEDEIPFDIPESWKWVRLGDCTGYSQTKPKISPKDITENMWSLDLEDIQKESGAILTRITASERKITGDKVLFYKGQVLYSKLRPYLKKILVAPDNGICTPELVPFNTYLVYANYIVYVLRSPHIDYAVNSVTYGVKMPRVGTETMVNLLIPLPPLAEQKRIVAKLEEILPLCERLK